MQRYVVLLKDGSREIVEYDTQTSSAAIERETRGGTILADYPTLAEAKAEMDRDVAREHAREPHAR